MTGTNRRRPNIVLILSDDIGFETVTANGGESYRTPVLDELSRTGMRFENGHVLPSCTPTRVELMTGKYNFRNYIGFGLMKPEEVTFGHLFAQAGYRTCISGKWQLLSYDGVDDPRSDLRGRGQRIEDSGFEEFCVWHAHHTEEKGSRYKDPVIYQNGAYLKDTKGKYGEDIFCDYILDFITRNRNESFFVYYPMVSAHSPFEPTPASPEFPAYDPPSNRTRGARTRAEVEGPQNDPGYYVGMIEHHDQVIGRVLEKLDALGLRQDTLVIYIGDNGSPVSVVSRFRGRDLRGGKAQTLEASTHVPWICNWPGTIPPGVVDDLVDGSDVLPTMLEVAGIKPPEGYVIDGRSFLAQLQGKKGSPREWVFFHFDPWNGRGADPLRRWVRGRRWKLFDDGRLYDLESDPDEQRPILEANDNPEQSAARQGLAPVFDRMK